MTTYRDTRIWNVLFTRKNRPEIPVPPSNLIRIIPATEPREETETCPS